MNVGPRLMKGPYNTRHAFLFAILSIASGITGSLYYPISGMGFVAMLDFFACIVAIPLVFMNWNRMGRCMKRSLVFGFYGLLRHPHQYWIACKLGIVR